MVPLAISAVGAIGRRVRLWRVPFNPLGDVEVEVLLAPDHPGEGLALNEARIGVRNVPLQMCVELVGFPEPACENPVEVLEGCAAELATQTQSDLDTAGGGHLPGVPRCGLGAALRRIHNRGVPKNDTIVKAVLEEAGSTGLIPESVVVRLVVAEQQFRGAAVGVQDRKSVV